VLVFFALPAVADDISYNFLELGYQQIDFDDELLAGVDIDGDGYSLAGSFEIGQNTFIAGGYSQADFDFGVKLDTLSLGLGYHVGMSDNVDVYGLLSAVRLEASASGIGNQDEDGYSVEIGLRGMIGDRFELSGSLGYVDLGDGGDGTEVGAGLQYYVTETFSLGLAVNVDEDVTAYGAGIRIYF
jgi:hypothetical protein